MAGCWRVDLGTRSRVRHVLPGPGVRRDPLCEKCNDGHAGSNENRHLGL